MHFQCLICNPEIWNIEKKKQKKNKTHITAILQNKRERKCETERFLLNLVHVGFYT